ncbi:m118L [Myxoma virus]|uniref:M118L n=2 Tax=Myxoma virus TaxID=10273 RepID=Q9Q8I3_MYXVL|nr:IMV membrane protein [Myxoma virus]ACB28913.1 m118L [recombinant virus 6918VP60-T2]AAF15006.1 m118L [Myxoma virus]ACB28741.1 m118L [Myxoma virus]ADI75416.1 M118L [Myxoma virus]ADK63758.1 m118L [Myxoma virus]
MSDEDINESNFMHLLSTLLTNKDIDLDTESAATLSAIKELISQINLKVLALNKKSKKNIRTNEPLSYVSKREGTRT